VEAAQAAAIARQFGISWHSRTNAERVVIDRPARLLGREEFIAALHSALAGAGASPDADVELVGYAAPLVAEGGNFQAAIEQVDFEPVSGRFTATLAMSIAGEPVVRMRLSGRAQEMVDAVVPTHRLALGTVLRSEDVQMVRVKVVPGHPDIAHTLEQVVGKAARRQVATGQPLLLSDVGRPFIIQKGSRVMMLLQAPGLSMTATGLATEPGGLGDRITVVNSFTGALIDGIVSGNDQVEIQANGASRMPARLVSAEGSRRRTPADQAALR
jgi:flagella basal body P-ring formation protein FlgA